MDGSSAAEDVAIGPLEAALADLAGAVAGPEEADGVGPAQPTSSDRGQGSSRRDRGARQWRHGRLSDLRPTLDVTEPACMLAAMLSGWRGGAAPRILIVDDDPNLLVLLADQLRADGFEIQTARDGEEALRRLEAAGRTSCSST